MTGGVDRCFLQEAEDVEGGAGVQALHLRQGGRTPDQRHALGHELRFDAFAEQGQHHTEIITRTFQRCHHQPEVGQRPANRHRNLARCLPLQLAQRQD
ncbi:MAG: hypothetical protein JHC88_05165 [Niveispirillum sp.]|nr:hypothetical protein [Niveispirillum sp.]